MREPPDEPVMQREVSTVNRDKAAGEIVGVPVTVIALAMQLQLFVVLTRVQAGGRPS